ncbi:unnamed protein product [Protopolystoma xenopodis]|uniref:Uncharacterized protein n=1 Tax=Protopolystoma xenopodis TaxID=117903 RepID=A0A448X9W7_9PLAT|nr:unnamed protein product [Protopolystoma xenopodis]
MMQMLVVTVPGEVLGAALSAVGQKRPTRRPIEERRIQTEESCRQGDDHRWTLSHQRECLLEVEGSFEAGRSECCDGDEGEDGGIRSMSSAT